MDPLRFIQKWRDVDLTERSASQQHFLDLCELVDHEKPAEADPSGEWFTFERGAAKHGGGDGWAAVWEDACGSLSAVRSETCYPWNSDYNATCVPSQRSNLGRYADACATHHI